VLTFLPTYGVCAELNNSPHRRAAHVLDMDEAGKSWSLLPLLDH